MRVGGQPRPLLPVVDDRDRRRAGGRAGRLLGRGAEGQRLPGGRLHRHVDRLARAEAAPADRDPLAGGRDVRRDAELKSVPLRCLGSRQRRERRQRVGDKQERDEARNQGSLPNHVRPCSFDSDVR